MVSANYLNVNTVEHTQFHDDTTKNCHLKC